MLQITRESCLTIMKLYENQSGQVDNIWDDKLDFTINQNDIPSINVMFLMKSLEDTKQFPVQLKSILYRRTFSLFLHVFVTDDVLNLVMTTLLGTWQADQAFYRIYQVQPQMVTTDWRTSILNLLKPLPPFITEVVYIGSDIFFLRDISEWLEISKRNMKYHFLIDNSIDNSVPHKVECNDPRSLIYVDVTKIKGLGIDFLINNISSIETGTFPCQLNPLSVSNLLENSSSCFESLTETQTGDIFSVKINGFLYISYYPGHLIVFIHEAIMAVSSGESLIMLWNQIAVTESSLFPNVFGSVFKNMSGYFSQSEIFLKSRIDLTLPSPYIIETHQCLDFLEIAHIKRRTLLFYHCGDRFRKPQRILYDEKRTEISTPRDVTLLTVLTIDKFAVLEKILESWSGPAAIAFYVTDYEAAHQLPQMINSSNVFQKVQNRIAVHVVYKRMSYYPINYLRNVLLNNTATSHHFYVDVDFVPSKDLYTNLVTLLRKTSSKSNKVFVVPAFNSLENLDKNFPPDKARLLKLLQSETLADSKQTIGWTHNHLPRNITYWMLSTKLYQVSYRDDFEPYVVVPVGARATFNEDLLEMTDRSLYIRLLHGMGFDFFVLPSDFIIHLPYLDSYNHRYFKTDRVLYLCSQTFVLRYRDRLKETFPNRYL